MLGEVSNVDARASRVPKGSILRPPARRRPVAPGLQRRIDPREQVPATGKIVFRPGRQILR